MCGTSKHMRRDFRKRGPGEVRSFLPFDQNMERLYGGVRDYAASETVNVSKGVLYARQ